MTQNNRQPIEKVFLYNLDNVSGGTGVIMDVSNPSDPEKDAEFKNGLFSFIRGTKSQGFNRDKLVCYYKSKGTVIGDYIDKYWDDVAV